MTYSTSPWQGQTAERGGPFPRGSFPHGRDDRFAGDATPPASPPPSGSPSAGAAPGVASVAADDERRHADIRRCAVNRMRLMSILHAEAAWQRRRRDPIEPHALAFLYVQPEERGAWSGYRLTAATRLWLHDGCGYDVRHRVFRFYRELAEAITPGADVRQLADRRDETMAADATFVGVGVCSLDTSTGSWRDVTATSTVALADARAGWQWGRARPPAPESTRRMPVEDHRDIPASIRIVFADGAIIVGERRGRPDFDRMVLHATHTLDYQLGESPYPWGWVTREQLDADSDHAEALRWMGQLCDLCAQADAARLDAARRQPPSREARR